jgi:hypothetical protein
MRGRVIGVQPLSQLIQLGSGHGKPELSYLTVMTERHYYESLPMRVATGLSKR